MMTQELGEGEIRIRFTLSKTTKKSMYESGIFSQSVDQLFTNVKAAEEFIEKNADWLYDAYVIKVWEKSIAHYVNGKKILH